MNFAPNEKTISFTLEFSAQPAPRVILNDRLPPRTSKVVHTKMMNSSTNNYPRKRRPNAVPTTAAASASDVQQQQRRIVGKDTAPGGDGRISYLSRRIMESQQQQHRLVSIRVQIFTQE